MKKLHRLNGSAVEYSAVEYKDESKRWYVNGLLHRLDGPAVEYADGSNRWYLNGKLHRSDGPAIENWNGIKKAWYIDGIEHTFKQWLEYIWDTLSIEEQEKYIFNGFEDVE